MQLNERMRSASRVATSAAALSAVPLLKPRMASRRITKYAMKTVCMAQSRMFQPEERYAMERPFTKMALYASSISPSRKPSAVTQ